MPTPTIIVSTGDPAGIGPEVSLKALADAELRRLARWVLVGERWLIEPLASELGVVIDQLTEDLAEIDPAARVIVLDARELRPEQHVVGQVSAACGAAGLAYVGRGVEACLAGDAAALVTGPLCKESVALRQPGFSGHTEYLAQLCGARESRLMLVNDTLAVVHVSTHCSLAEASQITIAQVQTTIELGHAALRKLRGRPVRVAVCGLNPHAGEHGLFGDDEQRVIEPAIDAARRAGIDCEGPLPADTLFMQAVGGKCDLVVAMYHDQGHVPMKLLDFDHTVNVTLGLSIIRTSVDHGTAFDIAGQNKASADDMQTAMRMAVEMARVGEQHT